MYHCNDTLDLFHRPCGVMAYLCLCIPAHFHTNMLTQDSSPGVWAVKVLVQCGPPCVFTHEGYWPLINDQSIRSTSSDAIVRSWLWQTAIPFFGSITFVVNNWHDMTPPTVVDCDQRRLNFTDIQYCKVFCNWTHLMVSFSSWQNNDITIWALCIKAILLNVVNIVIFR